MRIFVIVLSLTLLMPVNVQATDTEKACSYNEGKIGKIYNDIIFDILAKVRKVGLNEFKSIVPISTHLVKTLEEKAAQCWDDTRPYVSIIYYLSSDFYRQGWGHPIDIEKADQYWAKAVSIAPLYEIEPGIKKIHALIEEFLVKSCDTSGDAGDLALIASNLFNKTITEKAYYKRKYLNSLYEKVINKGLTCKAKHKGNRAYFLYLYGQGHLRKIIAQPDPEKAINAFKEASDLGNELAKLELIDIERYSPEFKKKTAADIYGRYAESASLYAMDLERQLELILLGLVPRPSNIKPMIEEAIEGGSFFAFLYKARKEDKPSRWWLYKYKTEAKKMGKFADQVFLTRISAMNGSPVASAAMAYLSGVDLLAYYPPTQEILYEYWETRAACGGYHMSQYLLAKRPSSSAYLIKRPPLDSDAKIRKHQLKTQRGQKWLQAARLNPNKLDHVVKAISSTDFPDDGNYASETYDQLLGQLCKQSR